MDLQETLRQLGQRIELNVFHDYFTKDQERLDNHLIDYLESARTHLVNNDDIERAKPFLKILLEYSWEKLNTGIWQNVKDAYRYLYAYACYIDVLTDCQLYRKQKSRGNYRVDRFAAPIEGVSVR